MGVGLGHSFLRHIQRTRLIVHVLDGTADDPIADYNQITAELALYDEKLADRPEIVVVNKLDMPEVREYWDLLKEQLEARGVKNPMVISALSRENVTRLIQRVFEEMSNLPDIEYEESTEMPVYELEEDAVAFEVDVEDGIFYVSGERIERAAAMTYWDYDEAVTRFQKTLEILGVSEALEKSGVKVGDTVFIGDFELEWSE